MRRFLGSLLVAVALVLATVSWSGFILTRTVLDPDRSSDLIDELLHNDIVRDSLVDQLADAFENHVPADIAVTRSTLEQAANLALDDPRVDALLRESLTAGYRNALDGLDVPVVIDAGELASAGRSEVVRLRPELDSVLPQSPIVEIEIPTSGLSRLGSIRSTVYRYTVISAWLSFAALMFALVMTSDRPPVLRRVAYAAISTGLLSIAFVYLVPPLLGRAAPSSASLVTAIVDVHADAIVGPAVMLAVAGGIVLTISKLLV